MRRDDSLQRAHRLPALPQSAPTAREHSESPKVVPELCESVYLPPETTTGWTLESLLDGRECRYFSYGRRALAEALHISGVEQGQAVALPALICREVLAAVHALGAVPSFYPVGEDLNLAGSATALPSCRALVIVNYFGFPQDLSPFRDHCRRTGAVLIEDNAHGLLSRDPEGTFLGLRGDIGLFSLRKTLPLPNGAALVLNTEGRTLTLRPQQAFDSTSESPGFRLKRWARRMVPLAGCRNLYQLISLTRRVKRAAGMLGWSAEDRQDETSMPVPENPSAVLLRPLRADIAGETARRRALYTWLDEWLRGAGLKIKPVFPVLPSHVVPYGYPFYADQAEFLRVRALLDSQGLDSLSWPDLPDAVREQTPDYYTILRVVPFLW